MACKPKSKDAAIRAGKLMEVYNKWSKDDTIKALTQGDNKYWRTFYEEVTQLDFDYGSMPNVKQIRKLDRKTDRMIKGLKKNPSRFAEWLYLPENILSKNPLTKKYFDSMIIAGNFYRGNLEIFTSDIDMMAKMIKNAARTEGAMRVFSLNRKSAQQKIQKMESEYQKLLVEDPNQAENYYRNNLQKMEQTEELKVVQGVYDLITSPEKLFVGKGQEGSLYDRYGTAAVQIARLWVGGKDKPGMRDRLYGILEDGLKAYTDVMHNHAVRTGSLEKTEKKLQAVLDQFQKQKNFYPTQALKIFPTLNKISENIYDSNTSKALEQSLPEVNKMLDAIVNDLKLDPHTFLSRGDVKRRSKDVVTVIDQYAKDVIRFNYTANATKNVTKAIQDLGNMKGTELETQIDFLSRYLTETHSTAVGTRYKNSKLAHVAKTITSWQFFQKLGLSPGTAARNATQSLQNFVYFGAKAWKDSGAYIKSENLGRQIETEMKRHGVFFVNLEEIAQTGDMLEGVKLVDGQVVRQQPGYNAWFTSSVEKLAKVSGKPMQWVENKLNRATTFKIAYSKMHQDLTNNNGLIRKRMEGKISKGQNIEDAIANEINLRSSRYAANMVKELHYEYSAFAKPKAIQTTAGSILGQFSTYGINFFEYNRKIAVNAGDSMLAGDWTSPEAARLYRMALLYGLTTAVLEPITNAKWSNLIEHDTKERLEQLFTFLTGDEKERKRTFFGKGPLLGTFGGPFVSDLFTLGNVIGFTKLSDNELMSYLQGYKQKARDVEDRRMKDAVGLLNMQLSKFIFSSAPKMRDGTGFMTILTQDYLQLWNTGDIKERREKMLLYPQKYGPEILKPIFTTAKQRKERQKRLKAVTGIEPQLRYAKALESLDILQEWGR
ncbi:hypothetical protein CMI37_23355 [Candidatus Pacearchaeota archaeon]|nr:hypothetical protein [Candidatus Pacearchaeota archaeon]